MPANDEDSGGINVGSGRSRPLLWLSEDLIDQRKGNKPPWTLPAKQAYGKYDGKRAQRYFGVSLESPDFFPILSILVSHRLFLLSPPSIVVAKLLSRNDA